MNRELTEKEKRNLKALSKWQKLWEDCDMGACADECYADDCEVFIPIQNFYFARRGDKESKTLWRAFEVASQKFYEKRKMNIIKMETVGDTIFMELKISSVEVFKQSDTTSDPHAVFVLTFDDQGKIISDHSYFPDFPDPASIKGVPGKEDLVATWEAVLAHTGQRYPNR